MCRSVDRSNDFTHIPPESLCSFFAFKGDLTAVKWAKESGFLFDWRVAANAAGNGHNDILKWVHAHSYKWDENACSYAAKSGNLKILQWLREHGCPWDERVCANAARGGHLDVLEWARDNGCKWDSRVCSESACGGYLHILQWSLERGCDIDKYALLYARMNYHWDVAAFIEAIQPPERHSCLPWGVLKKKLFSLFGVKTC